MSQHFCKTSLEGRPLSVTLGFDRRLQYLFLTVIRLDLPDEQEDDILYCNLEDPDAGTHCDDVDYYRRVLADLNIAVPESMFEETLRDQEFNVGNRVVDHTPVPAPG